ncbi:MAG TPA: hypothetical protein VFV50_07620 [Bdellovibrionales bacterium]|nr:hypothetical protein [Bdellovibrionales bacterium]
MFSEPAFGGYHHLMKHLFIVILTLLASAAPADEIGFDDCGPIYGYKIGELEKTEYRLRICELCCQSGRPYTIAEVNWLDAKTKKPKTLELDGGIGASMSSHRVFFENGVLAYQNEHIHELFRWNPSRGRFERRKIAFPKRTKAEQKKRDQLWEKFVKASDDDNWAAFDKLRKENSEYFTENMGDLVAMVARDAYAQGGILDRLLDEKIPLDIYDFQLRTPLFNLVEFIRPLEPEQVKLALARVDRMLAMGARLDIVDGDFESPLDKVLRDHGDDEYGLKVIEELKKRGARAQSTLLKDGARPRTPLQTFNPRFAKIISDEAAAK